MTKSRATNRYVGKTHAVGGERVKGETARRPPREAVTPLPTWTEDVEKSPLSRTYARPQMVTARHAYRKLVERHVLEPGPPVPTRPVTCPWCDRVVKSCRHSAARYAGHKDEAGGTCPNSYGLVLHVGGA